MNIKKLTTLLSGLVVLFGTTTAFAIWDTLEASIDTNTIQIGQGTGITATANIAVSDWIPNQQLVPTGVVLKSGDVESAVNVFTVAFSGTLSEDLKLDVRYADVLIGGDATYNNLVTIIVKWSYTNNFSINTPGTAYEDNLLTHADTDLPNFYDGISNPPETRANIYIQVTVTLAQPANSTAYNAVVNEDITFDLDFLAA